MSTKDTRGARGQQRPTLEDIGNWPPTVSVEDAARAIGISRAHAYRLLNKGQFPVEAELVGNRRVVMTESLLRWLRLKL